METEQWKSPRRLQEEQDMAFQEREEERRLLRLKVGSALADCVLEQLMLPSEAKKFYRQQFPEVAHD